MTFLKLRTDAVKDTTSHMEMDLSSDPKTWPADTHTQKRLLDS